MNCRIYWLNLQGSIDWTLCRLIFCGFFPTQSKPDLTCRVLYFTPSIKEKNFIYVLEVVNELCVESLMRSRGVYPHTYLALSRTRLCQEVSDRFNCCIKNLKKIWNLWVESQSHKWEYLWLQWIKERNSPCTRSCHVVMVVSFLLEVVIGC